MNTYDIDTAVSRNRNRGVERTQIDPYHTHVADVCGYFRAPTKLMDLSPDI